MPTCLYRALAACLLLLSASAKAGMESLTSEDISVQPIHVTSIDSSTLSLERAIALGLESDPGVRGASLRLHALNNEAVARGSLPDPRVSLMAGNLPVDSWSLDQEPMTQLSVGVQQAFPRGDTLRLKQLQTEQRAKAQEWARQDRIARVKHAVSIAWLQVYRWQRSRRLLLDDRVLFDQLRDIASARYRSTTGEARQQDVLRAELELSRIDERLTALNGKLSMARAALVEWVGTSGFLPVTEEVGLQEMFPSDRDGGLATLGSTELHALIVDHPHLLAVQQHISASDTEVDIVQQGYQPAWSVEARYGYRADDAFGNERADLFSVALSFDVPMFTASRQDRSVSAELARAEAARTDYQLLLRQWLRRLSSARDDSIQSDQRLQLYRETLLPQAAFVAEAALNAYDNDDGDFVEVVRARITQLDLRIQAIELIVNRAAAIAEVQYLTTNADSPAANGLVTEVSS